jgi:hypothetical protein
MNMLASLVACWLTQRDGRTAIVKFASIAWREAIPAQENREIA